MSFINSDVKEAWREESWKWHVNQMSAVYFQA